MTESLNATRHGAFYRFKVVMEHPDRGPMECITVWPVTQTKEQAEKRACEIYPNWQVKFSSKGEPVHRAQT